MLYAVCAMLTTAPNYKAFKQCFLTTILHSLLIQLCTDPVHVPFGKQVSDPHRTCDELQKYVTVESMVVFL